MNMEDNEAIENDWEKANLELFGAQYPFCSSSEATHGKDD
ncbi:putative prophage protein [Lactiplantibacillus plantarum]|nr:putative prophage protein [Lactiplantibacillus plantarum]